MLFGVFTSIKYILERTVYKNLLLQRISFGCVIFKKIKSQKYVIKKLYNSSICIKLCSVKNVLAFGVDF